MVLIHPQHLWILAACVSLAENIEFHTEPYLVTKLAENEKVQYKLPVSSKDSALILFYSGFFGGKGSWLWWFPKSIRQKLCPDLPCYYTEDKNLLKMADAVLFHGYENVDPRKPYEENFPKYRAPDQRWVFITREVPFLSNYTAFDGIFNWTVTYKTDSSVFMHFGRIVLRQNKAKNDENKNFATGKTRLAAWMSSHCHTKGNREQYIEELQKHMDVDMYGMCGNLKCAGRYHLQDCVQMLNNKYKFYLSFENALCTDYITEKLTTILAYGNTVPVTFGGADYGKFFPKHSYINALDFQSPEALANYLKMLDQNDTLYNQYFDWKRGYDSELLNDFSCDMCQKLLDKSTPPSTFTNFNDWWVVDSNCTSWSKTTK